MMPLVLRSSSDGISVSALLEATNSTEKVIYNCRSAAHLELRFSANRREELKRPFEHLNDRSHPSSIMRINSPL